jgi:hypothetical protein
MLHQRLPLSRCIMDTTGESFLISRFSVSAEGLCIAPKDCVK